MEFRSMMLHPSKAGSYSELTNGRPHEFVYFQQRTLLMFFVSFTTCINLLHIGQIGYWWESQKERDHYEDQYVGGWTILKWFSEW
jgi:hypothetical protein